MTEGREDTPLTKHSLLSRPVRHLEMKDLDVRPLIDGYREMAVQSRTLAEASDIYSEMLADPDCAVILTLAGSLISAGLKEILVSLVEHNMVDAIVSTGANIVDQDFFEALGFHHYIAPGSPEAPLIADEALHELGIDRIYDTYIDEEELRLCDDATTSIFDSLDPGPYSSRKLIREFGRYLDEHHPEARSIVLSAFRKGLPIFVPAFSDCSAGFGVVAHQAKALANGAPHVSFDSGRDFYELTRL
ncbi:MAG: deoxyhypusine synthase family protein, partial [Longimicrobiales bacterium]